MICPQWSAGGLSRPRRNSAAGSRPSHDARQYAPTREAAIAAFANSWRREMRTNPAADKGSRERGSRDPLFSSTPLVEGISGGSTIERAPSVAFQKAEKLRLTCWANTRLRADPRGGDGDRINAVLAAAGYSVGAWLQ